MFQVLKFNIGNLYSGDPCAFIEHAPIANDNYARGLAHFVERDDFRGELGTDAAGIAPIIAKPLVAAGVDPVHLGMVVVFNLMIGLLTPPMGLALFLVAEIAKVKMKDVLREMLPYYVPLVLTLLLITYFPAITTSIPRWALP